MEGCSSSPGSTCWLLWKCCANNTQILLPNENLIREKVLVHINKSISLSRLIGLYSLLRSQLYFTWMHCWIFCLWYGLLFPLLFFSLYDICFTRYKWCLKGRINLKRQLLSVLCMLGAKLLSKLLYLILEVLHKNKTQEFNCTISCNDD